VQDVEPDPGTVTVETPEGPEGPGEPEGPDEADGPEPETVMVSGTGELGTPDED
jgi:hypothetical protein